MPAEMGMEEIAEKSAQFMDKLLSGEVEPNKENLVIARFASANMSNFIRLLSVKYNQDRTMLRFAERLSKSPEDFAKYVQVALPDSGVTKMLKSGNGPAEAVDVSS
jgi:hypothetical protein